MPAAMDPLLGERPLSFFQQLPGKGLYEMQNPLNGTAVCESKTKIMSLETGLTALSPVWHGEGICVQGHRHTVFFPAQALSAPAHLL